MQFYEYKVVPAPEKAPRVKGLKGTPRFALGLEEVMNELAQDGWEYYRAESLPDTERKGFMGGSETVTRNVLVFRRALDLDDAEEPQPTRLTLSQPGAARAPVRATETDERDNLREIYTAADASAEAGEQTPVFRRPLVAARRSNGPGD